MTFDEWWSNNFLKHNMRPVDWAKSAFKAGQDTERETCRDIALQHHHGGICKITSRCSACNVAKGIEARRGGK